MGIARVQLSPQADADFCARRVHTRCISGCCITARTDRGGVLYADALRKLFAIGPLAVFGKMPAGGHRVESAGGREQVSGEEVWKNDQRGGRYRICEEGGEVGMVAKCAQRRGEGGGKKNVERTMEERRGELEKRTKGKGVEFPGLPRKRRLEEKEEVGRKRAREERVCEEAWEEKKDNLRRNGEIWSNGRQRSGIGAQSPTSVLDMHCSPKVDRQGSILRSEMVEREGRKRKSILKQVALRRCAPQEGREFRRGARDESVKRDWEAKESKGENGHTTSECIWLESMPKAKSVACSDSRIHGTGLFAMERIRAGEFVIEYGGTRWEKGSVERLQAEYLRMGIDESYIFELPDGSVIDGTLSESLARYINHSCDPNVCAHDVWAEGEYRVMLYAVRDVGEREELTCDYRFELEEEAKKIACLCGARQCQKFLNYDPDGFRAKVVEKYSS